MTNTARRGFTLIELILVIAIIAILAAAIFVSIDPARRLHESRNARRWSDVNTIVEAAVKFQTDNEGTHYDTIAALVKDKYYTIGTCATDGSTDCGAQTTQSFCVNLTNIGTAYMGNVPYDPKTGSDSKTDYYLMRTASGSVVVGACDSEGEGAGGNGDEPEIELTR